MRNFAVILFVFFYAVASAIDVKIENPDLVVDAKNNVGVPVIAAHSKLHVSGIKGKNLILWQSLRMTTETGILTLMETL